MSMAALEQPLLLPCGPMRTRVSAAPALLLAASVFASPFGCARDRPDSPLLAVTMWFHLLGRDPGRLLPLLTDEFHARHGLTIPSLEGWSWGSYKDLEPILRIDPALAPLDAVRGLDSAQEAFLLVQASQDFQSTARALVYEARDLREEGDHARVVALVKLKQPTKAFQTPRSFRQIFTLERDDNGWRIADIAQDRVDHRDAFVAFVAYPNEERRRWIVEKVPELGPKELKAVPSSHPERASPE